MRFFVIEEIDWASHVLNDSQQGEDLKAVHFLREVKRRPLVLSQAPGKISLRNSDPHFASHQKGDPGEGISAGPESRTLYSRSHDFILAGRLV